MYFGFLLHIFPHEQEPNNTQNATNNNNNKHNGNKIKNKKIIISMLSGKRK